MNHKKAIAHFRQLCCLPLSAESLGPALMEALHHVVPSLHNRIVWCNERRELTGMYCEEPQLYELGKLFVERFNNRTPDFPGTDWALSRPRGIGWYRPIVTQARYYRSEYFNEIERPVDSHHFMDMVFADDDGVVGMAILSREQRAHAFSNRDAAVLEHLIPYITHAMRAQGSAALQHDVRAETALMIADASGNLLEMTQRAAAWLSMAFHPQVRAGKLEAKLKAAMPNALRALCTAVTNLHTSRAASPPNLSIVNGWGRFRFTAALLHGREADARQHVGIAISYQQPALVAMMRSMYAFGLSTAQKQLCMLLQQNPAVTETKLAADLGVSASTVRDHTRKIYHKLGVHSRDAMLATLNEPLDEDQAIN